MLKKYTALLLLCAGVTVYASHNVRRWEVQKPLAKKVSASELELRKR